MGKSITSSAGVLALITVLIRTLGTPGTDHQPAVDVVQAAESGAASSAATNRTKTLKPEMEGPWTATERYFHAEPQVSADEYQACIAKPNEACLQKMVTALYGFPKDFDLRKAHTVMATVPDPLHTRLATETDRYLDAIQQAAFDSGYEFATQWLPWTLKTAAEKANGKEPISHGFELEKLPGLLVFRRHFSADLQKDEVDSLVLVFVVGETPTGGLNGYQFEQARQTMLTLDTNQPHELAIAGPNYSGSFLPLTRLLEESPGSVHVELRSGSATSFGYARAMLMDLEKHDFFIERDKPSGEDDKPRDNQPSVRFHGSSLPGSVFQDDFLEIARRLKIPRKQVAEIMEDETGFSYINSVAIANPRPTGDRPIIYRYSRDIAQLRNKYNDSAFSSSTQDQNAVAPVDFTLKDSELGEDAFPTFSPTHTPISQYAALEQIADHLRRSQVRLVSLSATNVFDRLFLAKILARNCPDTRIVLPGTDLLFVQEAGGATLSGVMAISPFPFFPEGTAVSQGRIGESAPPDVTTFTSSSQASEFDAMLLLLKRFAPPGQVSYRQQYLTVYNGYPSAWWLVLSSRGWMPVDVLQADARRSQIKLSNNKNVDWFENDDVGGIAPYKFERVMKIGVGWIALSALIAGLSLALCLRLVLLVFQPKKRIWSTWCLSELLRSGRPKELRPVAHARYFCMIACFASLAALNGFLFCPTLVFLRSGASNGDFTVRSALAFAFVAAAFAASSVIMMGLSAMVPWRVRVKRDGIAEVYLSPLVVSLRPLPAVLSLGSVYVWWTCCNHGISGYMLCFRTMTLCSPVSAICPLLLSAIGLFALFFFHLRRFTWGQWRQPHIATSIFKKALNAEFRQIKVDLERALVCIVGSGGRAGVVLVAIVIVIFGMTLLLFLSGGKVSSFERLRFSWMVQSVLALLGVFTVVTLLRFTIAWNLLRAFLVNLNSVALGRYFMAVPEFSGSSGPVWIREVKLMSMATVVNGGITLHNIEVMQNAQGKYTGRYGDDLKAFLSPNADTTRLQFLEAYEHFLKTAKDIADEVGLHILHPYWRKNQLPLVAMGEEDVPAEPAKNAQEATKPGAAAAAPTEELEMVRSAGAGRGTVQTFYLQSQTARTAFVGRAAAADSRRDESPSKEEYEQASRYVALHYSAYIGYALHQLQNLVVCSVVCFVLLVLALNSFSFQSPQAIFHLITVGLVIGGGAVLLVFAQMERDPILSRLSGTKQGELGKEFYMRAFTFGVIPVLTVLGTEFPSIARFMGSWIQPLTQLLH